MTKTEMISAKVGNKVVYHGRGYSIAGVHSSNGVPLVNLTGGNGILKNVPTRFVVPAGRQPIIRDVKTELLQIPAIRKYASIFSKNGIRSLKDFHHRTENSLTNLDIPIEDVVKIKTELNKIGHFLREQKKPNALEYYISPSKTKPPHKTKRPYNRKIVAVTPSKKNEIVAVTPSKKNDIAVVIVRKPQDDVLYSIADGHLVLSRPTGISVEDRLSILEDLRLLSEAIYATVNRTS